MFVELVAMTTIAAADGLGMPVSTTHVLKQCCCRYHGCQQVWFELRDSEDNTFCMDLYLTSDDLFYLVVYTGYSYSLYQI